MPRHPAEHGVGRPPRDGRATPVQWGLALAASLAVLTGGLWAVLSAWPPPAVPSDRPAALRLAVDPLGSATLAKPVPPGEAAASTAPRQAEAMPPAEAPSRPDAARQAAAPGPDPVTPIPAMREATAIPVPNAVEPPTIAAARMPDPAGPLPAAQAPAAPEAKARPAGAEARAVDADRVPPTPGADRDARSVDAHHETRAVDPERVARAVDTDREARETAPIRTGPTSERTLPPPAPPVTSDSRERTDTREGPASRRASGATPAPAEPAEREPDTAAPRRAPDAPTAAADAVAPPSPDARRDPGPAPAQAQETRTARDTGADEESLAAYQAELVDRLIRTQRYPLKAQNERLQGTVTLRFRLDENGGVVEKEIVTSSGAEILDRAALQMLDRASPFPPPPGAAVEAGRWFSVPIAFRLR